MARIGKNTVKETKEKLISLLKELDGLDENISVCIELDDSFGGSYIEDINSFVVNHNYNGNEVCITNF